MAGGSSLERLRKNPSQFSKLELPQMPYAVPSVLPSGPHGNLSRPDLTNAPSERNSGITIEIGALGSGVRLGRNAAKKVSRTDKVAECSTDERKARIEELMARGPISSAELSS